MDNTAWIIKLHCAIQNFKALGAWGMAEALQEILDSIVEKK